MFYKSKKTVQVDLGKGQKRRILGYGGKLMMVEMTFEKGAVGEVHTHPHEQVCYILKGSFEFELDGKKEVLYPGDSVYVPSGKPHGVKALEEESMIVDVFTPIREDFLEKN